jgi:hypothetical protein
MTLDGRMFSFVYAANIRQLLEVPTYPKIRTGKGKDRMGITSEDRNDVISS